MVIRISKNELARVSAAIGKAETVTRAEIFAVLTERSDDYRFVAYAFFAFWIFIISGVLALWLQWQGAFESSLNWNVASSYNGSIPPLQIFAFAQIAAFLSGLLAIRLFPSLAVAMTPGRITNERAHANGSKQFLAHGIHHTKGRTGVLVFISLEERFAEIFVDEAIEKTVGRDFFLHQAAALSGYCAKGEIVEGYVTVIEAIGAYLSSQFPLRGDNQNELENRFVIL